MTRRRDSRKQVCKKCFQNFRKGSREMVQKLEKDEESRKLYLNLGKSGVGFYTYGSDPIEAEW